MYGKYLKGQFLETFVSGLYYKTTSPSAIKYRPGNLIFCRKIPPPLKSLMFEKNYFSQIFFEQCFSYRVGYITLEWTTREPGKGGEGGIIRQPA
jgi:hypothetical protein